MSGLTDYRKYVADMSASSYFGSWKKQNPGEYSRWQAFDRGVQNGSQPAPPVLKSKFGQGMVDAGVMYLHAWDSPDAPTPVPPPIVEPPPVEPPVVTPPPSSSGPFQTVWDATRQPQRTWNQALTITSQQALNNWLGNRKASDHVICKGFTYNGRLEIRGGGPFWLEADPTFRVVNATRGSGGIGLWIISTSGATVTGYPTLTGCGNQGLRCQAAADCYLEVDCQGNGGNGALLDQIGGTGTLTGGVFKIRGGANGLGAMPPGSPGYNAQFYSDDLDPHAQKGTGAHHVNTWRLAAGSVLLTDIQLEQKYGAGVESTGWAGSASKPIVLAVRAVSLSCDVNKLPASPGGGRQAAGNAWQPWGDSHSYVDVKAIECQSAATGVYGNGIGPGCQVRYGRVGSPRLSPCWDAPGVAFQDCQPRP